MNIALIIGVSGQDGSYLSKYLLTKKNYRVIGTTRFNKKKLIKNHVLLGIEKKIKVVKLNYTKKKNVEKIITKYNPTEIYFLSNVTTIKESIDNIYYTIQASVIGTINILDVVKENKLQKKIKLFFAGSCECYGGYQKNIKISENNNFIPVNPYAVAKVASHNLVKFYRQEFNLKCCTGILSNHESILRGDNYVTKKIINFLKNYKTNPNKKLLLGNLNSERDWGWAPEYVKVFHKILNSNKIDDYIIATGKSVKLKFFLDYAFKKINLNWKNHVKVDMNSKRKQDMFSTKFNVSKIYRGIGWKAKYDYKMIIDEMLK
jgi:GDPmannose 4,6-dehydratase